MGEQSGGNLICVLESCMQVFEVKSVQFDWIVVILYDSQVQRLSSKPKDVTKFKIVEGCQIKCKFIIFADCFLTSVLPNVGIKVAQFLQKGPKSSQCVFKVPILKLCKKEAKYLGCFSTTICHLGLLNIAQSCHTG